MKADLVLSSGKLLESLGQSRFSFMINRHQTTHWNLTVHFCCISLSLEIPRGYRVEFKPYTRFFLVFIFQAGVYWIEKNTKNRLQLRTQTIKHLCEYEVLLSVCLPWAIRLLLQFVPLSSQIQSESGRKAEVEELISFNLLMSVGLK